MPIPRVVTHVIGRGGRVRTSKRGRIELEQILEQGVNAGMRAIAANYAPDVARTADLSVMRTGRPSKYWPIDTGRSVRGMTTAYDPRTKTIALVNLAPVYPHVIENRRTPLLRLFQDRRRKYMDVFVEAASRQMRKLGLR